MLKAFEISSLLAAQTTRPSEAADGATTMTSPAVQFSLIVTAMGLLALGLWIVRRLAHGRKLLLHDAPGRPNHLGWIHVAVVVGWGGLNIWSLLVAQREGMGTDLTPGKLADHLIMQAIVLGIALVAAHVGFRRGIVRGMGLSTRRWLTDTLRGLYAGLAVFPVCMALNALGMVLIPDALQQTHEMLTFLQKDPSPMAVWLGVVIAIVVAPIVEEVIYRGILQTALRRVLGGPWRGIIVSSLIFMAVHISFATEPLRPVGFERFAPLLVLAIVLGYNYERTGRLLPSIVTHAVFNSITVITILLPGGTT